MEVAVMKDHNTLNDGKIYTVLLRVNNYIFIRWRNSFDYRIININKDYVKHKEQSSKIIPCPVGHGQFDIIRNCAGCDGTRVTRERKYYWKELR